MLSLNDVGASYGSVKVLRGVNLTLEAGQILALLGRNGAGKTTTIRAVMGLMDRVTGSIRLDNVELVGLAAHNIPAHGVACVPQGRRLFPALTVEENLRMGLLAGSSESLDRLDWVLNLFPALKQRYRTPARSLSGGEQQMVAMGRALCSGPKVLLLDEPSEGLQPSLVDRMLETISELRSTGVAMLLVEQKVEAALRVADDIAFIENGVVCAHATAEMLRNDPEPLVRYVGVRRSG